MRAADRVAIGCFGVRWSAGGLCGRGSCAGLACSPPVAPLPSCTPLLPSLTPLPYSLTARFYCRFPCALPTRCRVWCAIGSACVPGRRALSGLYGVSCRSGREALGHAGRACGARVFSGRVGGARGGGDTQLLARGACGPLHCLAGHASGACLYLRARTDRLSDRREGGTETDNVLVLRAAFCHVL